MTFDLSGQVLVVAGEASGDHHAADLVRALSGPAPGLSFYGMGGPELAAAGMEVLHDSRDLAVMGLAEVAGSLRLAARTLANLRGTLESRSPAGVILVDFPDFNLRLARAAWRRGVPVVYFISPQIWAWRAGRVRQMARWVSRVVCIHPFEVAFYRKHGASAVYVGHPLVDQARDAPARDAARQRLGLPPSGRVLALLPGSRRQEVRAMLSGMLDAARRLRQHPGLDAVLLPVAATLEDRELAAAAGSEGLGGVRLVRGDFLPALAAADAALVASGTSTLAAAMMDTPMVVGYRMNPLTYVPVRYLTRVDHVGLVNLVAGRRVVPERIQEDFTGENLAREGRRLLVDGEAAGAQRLAFREVRSRLGPPGVFSRAAEAVVAGLLRSAAPGPGTGR